MPLAQLLELDRAGLRLMDLADHEVDRILAVSEIARRHQPHADQPALVRDPSDVIASLPSLRRSAAPAMVAILLDRIGRRQRMVVVASAQSGCAYAAADALVRLASEAQAASLIVAHNHPRGSTSPTEADVSFSRDLQQECRQSNVELTDHLIVGPRSWTSLRRARLLD